MLKSSSFLIIAACILAGSLACAQERQRYAVVTTRNGLVLRENPGVVSKKITVIPANRKVLVLGKQTAETAIGGVKGRWTEVQYFDTKGWVFGGFLLHYEAVTSAYAAVKSGVMVKKEPSPFSDDAALVPYREKMDVVDAENVAPDKTMGSLAGYLKVRWKTIQGYALDSDLSFIPIPDYGIIYDPKNEQAYEKNIITFFNDTMYRFGKTTEAITAALGPPLKKEIQSHPNRHETDKNDMVTSLVYDGMVISVMKIPSGDELMLSMEISSAKHQPGIALIGGPLQTAFGRFGIPAEDNGLEYTYYTDESAYCGFTLTGAKGVVTSVSLNCFPD